MLNISEYENKNKEIIEQLVSKYFSLDAESLKFFKEKLHEPMKPYPYDKLFENAESDRIIINLNDGFDLGDFDANWKRFKRDLYDFAKNITYEEFKKSRVEKKKGQVLKLYKAIAEFYFENYKDEFLDILLSLNIDSDYVLENGCLSSFRENLSNKEYFYEKSKLIAATFAVSKTKKSEKLYLVVSKNFADWFLCSTGESWASCLDLESDYMYGTGLPGLVGDPNRCMIYVTDGTIKNVMGIKVPKIIERSWAVLGQNDEIFIVKHYPNAVMSFSKALNNVLDVKVRGNLGAFSTSKEPIIPLYFNEGSGVFPYVDNMYIEKSYYLLGGEGGLCRINKDGSITNEPLFPEETTNILKIINEGNTLEDFIGRDAGFSCEACGESGIRESDIFEYDGMFYCEVCYNEIFTTCEGCNEIIEEEFAFHYGYEHYCEYCYHEKFIFCESCDEVFRISDDYVVETKEGGIICKDCASMEGMLKCPHCNLWTEKENLIRLESFKDDLICKDCLRKINKKNQLSLDFKKVTV